MMDEQAMDLGWHAMPEQQAQKKAFKGIGKVFKGVTKVVRPLAPVIGGVLGGPLGASVGGILAGTGGQQVQGMPQQGYPMAYPGAYPMYQQPGGFANTGIGGLIGHNLSADDRRKEFERLLGIQRGDWSDRLRTTGDEHLRMWDAMLPRRGQEFDQNLGFQQRMFDQWLPQQGRVFDQRFAQQGQMDDRSWQNWDRGLQRMGGLSSALGLK